MSRTKTPQAEADLQDAMLRAKVWVSLDRLWAQIPDSGCAGYCHTSQGPIGLSEAERDRVDRMYATQIRDGELTPGTKSCPALSSDGRCTVYMARPTVCRLWGSSDATPCTYGCKPDGQRLTELESMLLLNASLSLGMDNPELAEDYIVLAFQDEEIEPLIRLFVGGDRSHVDELRDRLTALWRGKLSHDKSKRDLASLADLAPEELPHGHAHKDTSRWCKGKEGREHKRKIVIPANLGSWWKDPCGWYQIAANEQRLAYTCHHVELCEECGKVLRRHYSWLPQARLLPNEMSAEECPDFEVAPAGSVSRP